MDGVAEDKTETTMSTPPQRLSVFLPDLGFGGAERSMLKLAAGMAARSYAVDLVLARAEGPLLAEVPRSVRLVDLEAHRMLASLPALVRYLQRERPVALLSVLHANVVALWARRLAGVPTRVIVSERNMLSIEAHNYVSDMRMRLMPRLARYFYRWADDIVAVSKGVADDLTQILQVPSERVRVIYNPIVTPELMAKAEVALEHPWFRPGEPPLILAVGRLAEQKDLPTLIRAFAHVQRSRPVRLLILGEGEVRQGLEALIGQLGLEHAISLPGAAMNPYPYMVRASLLALSSRWEGLPGVLIEALYCGVPIVSTDCPSGPREILADGQYGQLVPVGDVAALAQAMEVVLDGKATRPPRESWRPVELESVVSQYIDVLLGHSQ
jgi:glycosyltransferase involved in cell wall biosynthesis